MIKDVWESFCMPARIVLSIKKKAESHYWKGTTWRNACSVDEVIV